MSDHENTETRPRGKPVEYTGNPASASVGLCARLADLLWPPRCMLCLQSATELLCPACASAAFDGPRTVRCPRCGLRAASRERPCPRCAGRLPLRTVVLGDFREPGSALIYQLKFGARLALAELFAQRLAAALRNSGAPVPNLLVPVPLSAARLAQRGFNQSWEIARRLGRALDVPARADLIVKTRATPPQSRLPFGARSRNAYQAFALAADAELPAGLHIGVVDDVMTTGATLAAIADLLRTQPIGALTNFVVLRTPARG